jgi:hypothetical protein
MLRAKEDAQDKKIADELSKRPLNWSFLPLYKPYSAICYVVKTILDTSEEL